MLGMLRLAELVASGKDPVRYHFWSLCQQYGVTDSAGASPQGRTARLRHEKRRVGLEGPSGFPSFRPGLPACDWSTRKDRGSIQIGGRSIRRICIQLYEPR
jgi:hypothetical protein